MNAIPKNGVKVHKGNPTLKASGVDYLFTREQIEERIRCTQDPLYFIQKYMKIVHVDRGLVPFEMYDFQKELLRSFIDNRFTIAKLPRQVGKCFDVNAKVVIRYKKTYIITLEVGKLYEIVKDAKFEELLDLCKTVCEEHEKRLLLSGMSPETERTNISESLREDET